MTQDPEDRAAAAAAAWGVELPEATRTLLGGYARRLLESRTNLTADTTLEAVWLRHLADGLAVVPLLRQLLRGRTAPAVCDLGSGGGFIGIAVKAAWPEAEVTLCEKVDRKFRFLNAEAVRLGLPGLRVSKSVKPASFDAVVARALAPLPEALSLALPLCRPGGFFVDYLSDLPNPEPRLVESRAYRLPAEQRDRYLAVFAP